MVHRLAKRRFTVSRRSWGLHVVMNPRALKLQGGDAEHVEACQQSPACQFPWRTMQGHGASSLLLPIAILEPLSWSASLAPPPPGGEGEVGD